MPNGLWIHAGDSITWTFPAPEIHTVTFLEQNTIPRIPSRSDRLAQVSPEGAVQGRRPVGSSFDGSTCVTSGDDLFVDGATYTVTFPTAGNFKLVCLVHNNMTGAVHVLAASEALPHDQAFYDDQAQKRQTSCFRMALAWRARQRPQQSRVPKMP